MIQNKTLEKFVERAAIEVGAYGNHRTAHDLVDAETIAAARCQLANGELDSFTRFCYQREGNWLVNLSGNSQIPSGTWAPWGSSGKGRLSRLERDVVRLWLTALSKQRGPKPLYFYSDSSRRWHVDSLRYPALEDALKWLADNQLNAKLWLHIQGRLQGYE
jgi:Uri superfamily endonuclease